MGDDSDFLRIPEEVFYGYIFPHLNLNHLLRLRRTCKHIKLYSDDYIRNHHVRDQQREINEWDDTFGDFNLRDLPSSNIYLNNSTLQFFEDPCIPLFLKLYSPQIIRLRVKLFFTCITEAEKAFFTALTNLQHLEIDRIDARERNENSSGGRYFPPNFANLLTLKLNDIQGPTDGDISYGWDLIRFCTKLELVQVPVILKTSKEVSLASSSYKIIKEYMQDRENTFPDQPNLKYCDFQNERSLAYDGGGFSFYPMYYFKLGLKMLNIDALAFQNFRPTNMANFHQFVYPIVSMKNFWGFLLKHESEFLEKLVITSTAECTFVPLLPHQCIPSWPNLKGIVLTIDSVLTKKTSFTDPEQCAALIQVLFATVQRRNVKELGIRFHECMNSIDNPPCPRAQDIVRTCENVTKLTLSNWLGTNKSLSILWSGLLHLEEVVLDDCKLLADVAFVGANKDDPTFLKLKQLRKFMLSGLEQMPKITNIAFNLVFRHLPIREFYLYSRTPVKSITTGGIRLLLTGQFNKCVEKFPFHGWSLDNVPEAEFQQLKSEFRASHML